MQTAATDRMGLVAFRGDAFLECPLTIGQHGVPAKRAGAGREFDSAGRHGHRCGDQYRAHGVQGKGSIIACSC